MMSNKKATWIFWSVFSISILVYFFYIIMLGDDKKILAPGEMTHGHHQIEMACKACHTDAFGGGEVLQEACVNCHGAELKSVDDSHPKSKFTNPRNASRVKELDARACVTCHSEHKNQITGEMGVTLPEDFCFKCHQDVAEDRPSHMGMAFTTCANAGCHNYHDNSALYEDFLEKHLHENKMLDSAQTKIRSKADRLTILSQYPIDLYPVKKLTVNDMDSEVSIVADNKIIHEWETSSHAETGVNCSACHSEKSGNNMSVWIENPTEQACKRCHSEEVKGFLDGKHGMKIKAGLAEMTPAEAKQPMLANADNKKLGCVSCHSSHRFDVRHAAVDACLSCHNDKHSKSYKKSPHFQAWNKASNDQSETNTGVSCASCHMPRQVKLIDEHELVLTEHNQSLNLRPNEKMLRSVCMNCHGLGFSIDALADKKLIKNNFKGMPSVHVESIDMVKDRLSKRKNSEEDAL